MVPKHYQIRDFTAAGAHPRIVRQLDHLGGAYQPLGEVVRNLRKESRAFENVLLQASTFTLLTSVSWLFLALKAQLSSMSSNFSGNVSNLLLSRVRLFTSS